MQTVVLAVFTAILLCATSAFPQMERLGPKESFSAARLTAKESAQIIAAIQDSAYDVPDSWESELRVRRVDLGAGPGLVVEGTNLLCGATGNCQIWVLRKIDNKWVSLFATEQATIAEGVKLGPTLTRGIKDLIIVANMGGQSSHRITYKFDGKAYQGTAAAQVDAAKSVSKGSFDGQELELKVHPSKLRFALGEPIYLIIEVVNHGKGEAMVPSGCCTLDVTVTAPGFAAPNDEKSGDPNGASIVKVCGCPIKFMRIAPHKSFREQLLLNKATGGEWYEAKDDDWSKGYLLIEHFVLKHKGKYEISIAREIGSQHSNGWLYDKAHINVSE